MKPRLIVLWTVENSKFSQVAELVRRWEVEIQKSGLTEACVNPMAGTRLSPKSTTCKFKSCPDYKIAGRTNGKSLVS